MRVAGLYYTSGYRNKNNYGQLNSGQRTASKSPAFKGQEYFYQITSCGVDGLNCDLNREGNYICSGTSGAGQQKDAAVSNAIRNVFSGSKMKVQVINPSSSSGNIYIADPEETLTQDLYNKYDYLATDNRPNIPTLNDLDHKFHDFSNPVNYNKKFGALRDYYARLLNADTIQLNKYRLKQEQDNNNLKTAIVNKNLAENELRNDYNNSEARKEFERQSYFIYINNEKLKEDKEKIDYYEYKNIGTREKIEFVDNIVGIINKTGRSLMDRDVLADNLRKNTQRLHSQVVTHIRILREMSELRAEKICADAKLQTLYAEIKRLRNQDKTGNAIANTYLMENIVPEYDGDNPRIKEISAIKCEIREINSKLHQLKIKKAKVENEIKFAKIDVAIEKEKLNQQIKNLEPIFEELKSYYETNYPFD